jgi:DNA polymerase (family 10)
MMRAPEHGSREGEAAVRRRYGIDSLEALRAGCGAGRVRVLKGFGAKSEEKILEGMGLFGKAG